MRLSLRAARCASRHQAVLLIALSMLSASVDAQSLDDQYDFYLAGKCDELNFARDAFDEILPGQAGPNLFAYCTGPIPVAGASSDSTSGGGAGVAGAALTDDSAIRRRRSKARGEATDSQSEVTLVNSGQLGVFLSLDYLHEKQDTTHFEGGRSSDSQAFNLGTDYRFGKRGLIGIAIRGEHLNGDFDTGGDFQSHSIGFTAYGSWYPTDAAFVDLTAGMNSRSDESHRLVSLSRTIVLFGPPRTFLILPPTPANGDRNRDDFGAQLSGGYDFYLGGFTVGPRLGAAAQETQIDAYVENGDTPMTLAFDEQDESSLRSSVGVQMSQAFSPSAGVFVTQFNVDWQHEFKDDQRVITAHFAEDIRPNPTQVHFQNEAPDRDVYLTRLSLVGVFANGISGYVSANALLGHDYMSRYGASVGLRMTF